MPIWTYIKQQREINNLNSQINNKNAQIYQIRQRIAGLNRQLASETSQMSSAYSTKEVWRRKIEQLIQEIKTEEAKIPILNAELDKENAELKRQKDILAMGDEDHRVEIETFNGLNYILTDETDKNIKVNQEYYHDIQSQNATLLSTVNNLKITSTTYDKKATNENNKASVYEEWSKVLLYLYYIILIILLYLIYSKDYIPNIYVFVVVAVLLGTYPMYILKLEQGLYASIAYIWALIHGKPVVKQ
jgi:chromosome segregation ATPase